MDRNKRNILTAITLILGLLIGLFFDIKYKGAIYRIFSPRDDQS